MFDEAEFPVELDWLSEEKYNLMKEKHNNMAKKKIEAAGGQAVLVGAKA